jgi:hypothetical protein
LLAAASPVDEFADRTKFSTEGRPKANGLIMSFEYPSKWIAEEAGDPTIVQAFVRSSREELVLVQIEIKPISLPPDATFTEQDLKDLFTPSQMKQWVSSKPWTSPGHTSPRSATFIDAKPTKIAGLPAGILEYSVHEEREGKSADARIVAFIFVHKTNNSVNPDEAKHMMVWLTCSVSVRPGQAASLQQRMSEFMPLFTMMANSIVVPDKWKFLRED